MKKSASRQPSLTKIIKRDGSTVAFDKLKIARAIEKAMIAAREFSAGEAEKVAGAVCKKLLAQKSKETSFVPTVEGVQDLVEAELMFQKFSASAKSYILYRAERTRVRELRGDVPDHVRKLAEESEKYFQNNSLGEFVYLRSYARWIESENRRETWIETVTRYIDFMKENLGDKLSAEEYEELKEGILKQQVMPSMRLMQFAGEAARRCNSCAYNCSYIAPTKIKDFGEIMYLCMVGCGVGWSVESYNIEQLPQIKKQGHDKILKHTISDTREGWADALVLGMETWYKGRDIEFDYSQLRPAGARLKTMGGKSSGPEPLQAILNFTREKILHRQGRRLRNIDAHDIICKIGEGVVSGGVRRTAMISLSDLDDALIRDAKKGQFFLNEPQRSLSNNSAVYENPPSNMELMDEWVALMRSGTGERGIFSRGSLAKTLPKRRLDYFKKQGFVGPDGLVHGSIGVNPCGEIILQSKEFCNLSEVVARSGDTEKDLVEKARLAAILGTYQSTLTKFSYISKDWVKHCEEERLLGVSLTGQWDCEASRRPETLRAIRQTVIETNKLYAKRFGINPSMATTAVKPSGTVSQTVNCSSGMHPRHSKYYIRRVRISATDSLFKLLRDQGVPHFPEVGQTEANANTFVLEFPVEAPEGSIFRDDQTALEQLEHWKKVKLNFTEQNPSTTISVGENEWIGVVSWLEQNWDIIGGLSFLPRSEAVYRLAPYEAIDKKRYDELLAAFPKIDYAKLVTYERTDETDLKKELACVGNTCEIDTVDLPLEARPLSS